MQQNVPKGNKDFILKLSIDFERFVQSPYPCHVQYLHECCPVTSPVFHHTSLMHQLKGLSHAFEGSKTTSETGWPKDIGTIMHISPYKCLMHQLKGLSHAFEGSKTTSETGWPKNIGTIVHISPYKCLMHQLKGLSLAFEGPKTTSETGWPKNIGGTIMYISPYKCLMHLWQHILSQYILDKLQNLWFVEVSITRS